uniref:Uncharacterized protein n=1 Tax=uncultured organism TaxID=155900 RepID=M1PVL5_9ZZZZ|nr:hypothetical protein FLSS-19_0022 [uncultured organism]
MIKLKTRETSIKAIKINNKLIETKIWETNLKEQTKKPKINTKNIETKLWEREL